MTNHPNRSTGFEIVAYHERVEIRPWFIRVDTGCLDWPKLEFPFQMPRQLDQAARDLALRNAARAALKAASLYYRHDDTGSFRPSLWLLNADQKVIHEIPVVRTDH